WSSNPTAFATAARPGARSATLSAIFSDGDILLIHGLDGGFRLCYALLPILVEPASQKCRTGGRGVPVRSLQGGNRLRHQLIHRLVRQAAHGLLGTAARGRRVAGIVGFRAGAAG